MDGQSVSSQRIEDFDTVRKNVTGKLNLEHWMILPSERTVHIFSLNKKPNGNLSIRNTICIDVDLIVKVFGENNDDMLFSLRLYSWPQLRTLIEQCGTHLKRDVEFVEVVDQKSETNSCKVKHQQDDNVEVEFRGVHTETEVEDSYIDEPLTKLIESVMDESEALVYNHTFVSQSSSLHESSTIYSEDANPTAELMHHKTIERYIPQSQICPVCGRTCVDDMDRHMDQHFNGKSYQCHVCGREYQNSDILVKHVKSKHGEGDEFFCDICKTHPVFETKASIEDHMKNKHFEAPKKQGSMKCSTCGKEFFTRKQFTAHVSGHDKSKWKPCPICNKRYSCLNRHIRDMHLNIRNHVCDICGSAYKQYNTLKEHIEIRHSPHEEFFCDICQDGKSFRSKGYIKKHFAKVHVKGQRRKNDKPFYECSYCNVKLPSRYSLKKHVSLPHNDGKHPIFPCKTCDKTFTVKSSLVAHERTHIWHICHETGQPINHPTYLKAQLKQHKDIKKQKCKMCTREYVRNFDLVNHIKKVHGVKVEVVE